MNQSFIICRYIFDTQGGLKANEHQSSDKNWMIFIENSSRIKKRFKHFVFTARLIIVFVRQVLFPRSDLIITSNKKTYVLTQKSGTKQKRLDDMPGFKEAYFRQQMRKSINDIILN